MKLLGGWIPFIGWREYEAHVVEEIAEYIDIDSSRRYSGFHLEWLGYGFMSGMKDLGPRGVNKQV